jgi:multidrug efflux pump subunit AcrA (membrane-fusion protein)
VKRVLMGLMVVFSANVLLGCSESGKQGVMTVAAKISALKIVIPAKGEIVAAHSTNMSVPVGSGGTQTVAWLIPENTLVKKGDVIARFDGETFVNERDSAQLDLNSADLETQNKSSGIVSEKADIKSDAIVVDKEIDFSDQFNIEDLTVYSKNDIIDALDNRGYLSARKNFLAWKLDNFSYSSASEMELMALKAQQYQTKLDQYELALTQLEVYAPHDGILIYEKNWRGEKPRIGQTMWPGRKLAKLPELSVLKAKLFVLENEAGNIAVGNKADITLDARPDTVFKGVVEKKDNIAKSIRSGNPVKYFEITVSIENPDLTLVKPGNKVTANIKGGSELDVLIIPIQAVFSDDAGSFVYVDDKGKVSKKPVVLGMKTFAEVEIKSGIDAGDKVALFQPVVL